MAKKTFTVIITLFLLLLISACKSDKVTYGVVDRERILKESVYREEIEGLNAQIAELENQLSSKKLQVEKEIREKEESIERASQQEWQARVKAREEQLNTELLEKHKDFFAQKEREFVDFVTLVENEVNGKLNDLMAKLADGTLPEAERQNIDVIVEDIKTKGEQRLKAKNDEIKNEVDGRLAEDRRAMSATLGQFANNVREEIFEKYRKEIDTFAEGLLGEGQRQQTLLKEKHDALSKTFDENIHAAIEEVAKAKGLETVFIKYFVNVNATDITSEVLQKVKENKEKGSAAGNKP